MDCIGSPTLKPSSIHRATPTFLVSFGEWRGSKLTTIRFLSRPDSGCKLRSSLPKPDSESGKKTKRHNWDSQHPQISFSNVTKLSLLVHPSRAQAAFIALTLKNLKGLPPTAHHARFKSLSS